MNSSQDFFPPLLQKNIRRLSALTEVCYKPREEWTCPVVHVRKLAKLSEKIALPLLCGRSKGRLKCPPELTILLIHTYADTPIMEKSLHYVGIDDFVVRKPVLDRPWSSNVKLMELMNFLDSDSCKTEYVLYCDSDDAVLRDDPAKAIRYLEEEDCDLLMSNTNFQGAYECMPEVRQWALQNAREHNSPPQFINAGVFIGRAPFLREVIAASLEYVTDSDLHREEYWQYCEDGTLRDRLPDFPRGIGSDQVVLRYLHPRFYPRMKVDYKGRLALR